MNRSTEQDTDDDYNKENDDKFGSRCSHKRVAGIDEPSKKELNTKENKQPTIATPY